MSPRKTISITMDTELLKRLRRSHLEERIRRLRESEYDLPFSYFIEELIESGLRKHEKGTREESAK